MHIFFKDKMVLAFICIFAELGHCACNGEMLFFFRIISVLLP